MAAPLTPNPDPNFAIELIGRERQPVLIIDDCLVDPHAVQAIAVQSPFSKHGPHYPGVRAPVPQAACNALIAPLAQRISQTFGLSRPPKFDECFLSLVTTSAQELRPIQRMPHFDGLETERLAFLLYLDQDERSGTAFYRHRVTGFETVDAARFAEFQRGLEGDIAQHGMPDSEYIRGDTVLFEQVGKVAGRFNRAVVYHGNSLHCADLPPDFTPNADPKSGRLTLNLFLLG